ncbi:hypothetical protein L249_4830 [Ophiocordyceps polyrhachis-furcata BCC 54312]|uniref:Uncharacterized protein n=1 Tax=Ophiocordyceps polyrhachis-furcata BCC 54312 TaxID=1330021 RepID=A0A367L2P3_9HYPO|nr:hypothetical protein L249_4830 [Ophiocordyceps polyrhachis-furcata BCC 54312]
MKMGNRVYGGKAVGSGVTAGGVRTGTEPGQTGDGDENGRGGGEGWQVQGSGFRVQDATLCNPTLCKIGRNRRGLVAVDGWWFMIEDIQPSIHVSASQQDRAAATLGAVRVPDRDGPLFLHACIRMYIFVLFVKKLCSLNLSEASITGGLLGPPPPPPEAPSPLSFQMAAYLV